MMRLSSLLRRTSRKGPGSWSEPTLSHSRHRLSERSPQVPSQQTSSHPASSAASSSTVLNAMGKPFSATTSKSSSRNNAQDGLRRKGVGRDSTESASGAGGASSAAFYDGADNAYQYSSARGMDSGYGAADHPSHYSWKADPSFNKPPPQMDFTATTSLRGAEHGSLPHKAKRVSSAAPPIQDVLNGGGSAGDARGSASRGASSSAGEGTNWLGGDRGKAIPDTLERATMQHAFGAGDFSMVDREKITLTRLLRLMADATLKPRDADSRAFGGDGATRLAEQREELKTMDQRIVPYQHDDLLNDYLKNVDQLHTPSGALCQREVLQGRLVGLLFFTESERSRVFMQRLQPFHKKHSPDFVVVAVSMAGKEMMDLTRAFGFFHCTHRDGATWVARDTGMMVRPFVPLPRLVVVNGTTGVEVTRGGVTAVVAHPDTCFQAWRRGERGYEFRDYLESMYL